MPIPKSAKIKITPAKPKSKPIPNAQENRKIKKSTSTNSAISSWAKPVESQSLTPILIRVSMNIRPKPRNMKQPAKMLAKNIINA